MLYVMDHRKFDKIIDHMKLRYRKIWIIIVTRWIIRYDDGVVNNNNIKFFLGNAPPTIAHYFPILFSIYFAVE